MGWGKRYGRSGVLLPFFHSPIVCLFTRPLLFTHDLRLFPCSHSHHTTFVCSRYLCLFVHTTFHCKPEQKAERHGTAREGRGLGARQKKNRALSSAMTELGIEPRFSENLYLAMKARGPQSEILTTILFNPISLLSKAGS